MGKIIDIRKVRPAWQGTRAVHEGGSGPGRKFEPLLSFCKQIHLGEAYDFIFSETASPQIQTGDFIITICLDRVDEASERPEGKGRTKKADSWYFSPAGDRDVGSSFAPNEVALRPRGSVSSKQLRDFFTLGHEVGWIDSFLRSWFERNTRSTSLEGAFERLTKVQIPVLPDAVLKTFTEAFGAGEWLSDFLLDEPSFDGVLSARSPDELSLQIARIKAWNYAIRQAISESRDLRYLIANFFPIPLAFPYRGLSVRVHPLDLFREQIRMAENIIAFVGSIVLSFFTKAPSEVRTTFAQQRAFGIGIWLSLIREAGKSLPRDRIDDLPGMLAVVLQKTGASGFLEHANRLIEIRNRHYGHGNPDLSQLIPLSQEVQSLIDRSMEQLSFLVQYPVFRVLPGATKKRGKEHITHIVQEYSGDNPAHKVREMSLEEVLPEGVYVQTEEGPKDLYPFITVHICPRCGTSETFFLDRKKRKAGDWMLKSFERGHEIETREFSTHIDAWLGELET